MRRLDDMQDRPGVADENNSEPRCSHELWHGEVANHYALAGAVLEQNWVSRYFSRRLTTRMYLVQYYVVRPFVWRVVKGSR